jgi:predicted dehydrogenase
VTDNNSNGNNIGRRSFLKAAATVPFLGAFLVSYFEKNRYDNELKDKILTEFKLNQDNGPELQTTVTKGNLVRVGIIGFGFRGEQLARAAGYAHPDWIEEKKTAYEKNQKDTSLKEFYEQDNLNIEITGICDVFDIRAERGLLTAGNKNVKRYRHYQDMLNSSEIDAVIIATPDHWHAKMSIDAVNAGKHVYLEKCMTQTVKETFDLREAVKRSDVAFQLGHTGRQNISYLKAKKIINDGILGPISIIEMPTNRNNPFAAWIWPIHKDASEKNIDWEQFVGPAPYHPFSLERFFQWRRWWDYGTGMSGDLLTHEFDAINMIMEFGVPASATASGGYTTGRTGGLSRMYSM